MSIEDHNEKTLRKYLLGMLPEAETERLDELSVTEDEFAQQLRIVEDDLIDAYVNSELTGPELLNFPRQYLSSPLGLERVRFAQAFRDNKQAQLAKTEVESRNSPLTSTASFFSFNNRFTLKWALVAASLMIFLVASWFIVHLLKQPRSVTPGFTANSERQGSSEPDPKANANNVPTGEPKVDLEHQAQQSPTPPVNQPGPSRVVAFVLKPQMRSVSQPVELTIPDDTSTIALTLQLEPGDAPYYRPILTETSSDRVVWQGGRIKSTTNDEMSVLQVRVPAALLKQGAYKIRVVAIYANGTTEATSEFNFRVVK